MSGARASGGADTTEATRTSGMSNRLARDQPRNCQLGLPIASIAVVLVDSSRAQDSQQVVEPQGLGRQTSPPGKGADGKGAFSSSLMRAPADQTLGDCPATSSLDVAPRSRSSRR